MYKLLTLKYLLNMIKEKHKMCTNSDFMHRLGLLGTYNQWSNLFYNYIKIIRLLIY